MLPAPYPKFTYAGSTIFPKKVVLEIQTFEQSGRRMARASATIPEFWEITAAFIGLLVLWSVWWLSGATVNC